MSKNIQNLFKFAFVFIVIVIGNYVIVAQNAVSGDWKAEYKAETADKIYLSFSRKSEDGRNQMGSKYALSDLQGLSVSQINGSNSSVKFPIVREAGNVECEGKFTNGKGAGTYIFTFANFYQPAYAGCSDDVCKKFIFSLEEISVPSF